MPTVAEKFIIKESYGTHRVLEMPLQAVQVTGLAMPPLAHRTVRAPFQHGATYIGMSLSPRMVQFALHLRGCDRLDMWSKRNTLINLINPLRTLRIQVVFKDSRVLELREVVYDTGFEAGTDGQREPTAQSLGMRFVAYDPVWYLYPENSQSVTMDVTNELVFPITFPYVWFGRSSILQTVSIVNGGNWLSYPRIVLEGPLQNPTIYNETTGEVLELVYGIVTGEVVTIETRFGQKSITNDGGANLLGYLTTDSDLATFHLDPHPIATNGANTLTFSAAGCVAGTSAITIYWYDRYLGI